MAAIHPQERLDLLASDHAVGIARRIGMAILGPFGPIIIVTKPGFDILRFGRAL